MKNMLWLGVVDGLVTRGVVGLTILYYSNVLKPLYAHPGGQGQDKAVADTLLKPWPTTIFGVSYTWLMFGAVVILFLLATYAVKFRPRRTHGSAHHASRGEARKYYAPFSLSGVCRPARAVQLPATAEKPQPFLLFL